MLSALGTDTGGSVRLPAAYAGIFGFKPSYGIISRHGVVTYANSLDTVGIMSKDLNSLEEIFSSFCETQAELSVNLNLRSNSRS